MFNFPGRSLVSYYLPRNTKEFLLRNYNRIKPINTQIKYPENISISLTTHCNLRCRFCDREEFNASYMSLENLKKLENPIKHAKQIDLTGWGEAILYKHYKECVKYILETNLNDKIIALKDKLENVSKELEGSNAVLSEIGKHPNGALGWASEQMSK